MTKKRGEIYKCNVCGNVVEVLEVGGGTLVCCKQDMALLKAKGKGQEKQEKHVPIMERDGGKVTVKVGAVPHPMEEEHFIEQIELLKDGLVIRSASLLPAQEPMAEFCVDDTEGLSARELCNVHGLWKS